MEAKSSLKVPRDHVGPDRPRDEVDKAGCLKLCWSTSALLTVAPAAHVRGWIPSKSQFQMDGALGWYLLLDETRKLNVGILKC